MAECVDAVMRRRRQAERLMRAAAPCPRNSYYMHARGTENALVYVFGAKTSLSDPLFYKIDAYCNKGISTT